MYGETLFSCVLNQVIVLAISGIAFVRRRMGRVRRNTGRDWTENSHCSEAGIELVTEALQYFLSVLFDILFLFYLCFFCYSCLFGAASVYSIHNNFGTNCVVYWYFFLVTAL